MGANEAENLRLRPSPPGGPRKELRWYAQESVLTLGRDQTRGEEEEEEKKKRTRMKIAGNRHSRTCERHQMSPGKQVVLRRPAGLSERHKRTTQRRWNTTMDEETLKETMGPATEGCGFTKYETACTVRLRI
ncbi:hypothetical protein NDU88_001885 [Pleurodeles waltl]|uniref:Uncharacterized protein n=1 Tax=Pleurodeles waltl TaxID=8319 RepID=A0AAV7U893_PLEWA|nr:hypothetical protein NDU88_001885 [Pleurodeles waltl]